MIALALAGLAGVFPLADVHPAHGHDWGRHPAFAA